MNDFIVIRDAMGTPRLAELLRWVTFPPNPEEFAVTKLGDTFTVTETISGCCIGSATLESLAVEDAQAQLKNHSRASFECGVKYIIDQFGELPTVQQMVARDIAQMHRGGRRRKHENHH